MPAGKMGLDSPVVFPMIRKIVFYPDPVLRKVGEPVTEVTDEIRELASDMLETMYDANGVGLAAQQVGEAIQLAIVG